MRNGILLAEDSPSNILVRHEVENLEEAFLKLCMKRGVSEEAVEDDKPQNNGFHMELERMDPDHIESLDQPTTHITDTFKRKKYAWITMRALFTKNYLQMKRQPA